MSVNELHSRKRTPANSIPSSKATATLFATSADTILYVLYVEPAATPHEEHSVVICRGKEERRHARDGGGGCDDASSPMLRACDKVPRFQGARFGVPESRVARVPESPGSRVASQRRAPLERNDCGCGSDDADSPMLRACDKHMVHIANVRRVEQGLESGDGQQPAADPLRSPARSAGVAARHARRTGCT